MSYLFLNKESKKTKWTKKHHQKIPKHPTRPKVLKTKSHHLQEHRFSTTKISGTINMKSSTSLPVLSHISHLTKWVLQLNTLPDSVIQAC